MSIILRLSMRISSQMTEAINNQIVYEASGVHAYIAIGSWCERTGYDGSAAFFFEQANEEHSQSTFQVGLKSEQTVTGLINNLVEVAENEKDRATYSFLQWFVNEQIEEETLFETILQKFDIVGRDKLALYQIDQSLTSIRSKVMTMGNDKQQPTAN